MRKLIPLLTAAVLGFGGLAATPQQAAARPLAVPVQAIPVHWGYGGGGPPPRAYAPPPRWGGGGGWYR